MKKLLLLTLILVSTSSFACQCVSGFLGTLNYKKEQVVSNYLNVQEQNINSVRVLNSKERKSFIDLALGIVFYPLIVTAGECERSCSTVRRAGEVTFLVNYLNKEGQTCDKVIRVKGRVSNYETLKMRNKFISFGEFCSEGVK